MSDLPYIAEYARSARSSCKVCHQKIEKGILRLATVTKSPMFDGKMTHWYHYECFFKKQKIRNVAEISNFESIRWEDQENIKKKIDERLPGVNPDLKTDGLKTGGERSKKRKSVKKKNEDFAIQYAKSSRSECKGCGEKIIKGDIRISKKDYESDEARRFGGLDKWHHVECFVKLRNDLEFYDSAGSLFGLDSLSTEHQKEICDKIPKITPPAKSTDEVDNGPSPKKSKIDLDDLKNQNVILFEYRDKLSELSSAELTKLLRFNDQQPPTGKEEILNLLADAMVFGVLSPCELCSGQYEFRSGVGYYCTGNRDEWMKCENVVTEPERGEFKIPEKLETKYSFLESYKYVPRKRIFQVTAPATVTSTSVENTRAKLNVILPLKNMTFVVLGVSPELKATLKFEIAKLGGKVIGSIYPDTTGIVSTKEMVKKAGKHMEKAKSYGIQVVPESFVDACKEGGNAADHLISMNLASWGSNPLARLKTEEEKMKRTTEIVLEKKKLQVKGGMIVDPESCLEDRAHVYREGKDIYSIALCLSDLQSERNSYYKMQILESDNGKRYWFFRSWGRIGTTIGDHKTESLALDKALRKFRTTFLDKTKNDWYQRNNFVKYPGKMVLMDVSYDDAPDLNKKLKIPSKLPPQVQDLMSLIFNINDMKDVMLEYELDYDKMPLGKLSKRQIQEAYSILTKLQEHIEKAGDASKCVSFSNQFYTLVPHNFGNRNPPIIDNLKLLQEKREILDNLLEMEIAYSIMNTPAELEENVNSLDQFYEKLNAVIEVVEKDSDEFKMLKTYTKNTHAQTHSSYSLKIAEAYRVKRHEEERRFKPFKKLHNRKLLWHGSRLTNFAGILSQGLRIAPKEAPTTGYMFGKGIYFADMVSKSANYCATKGKNDTGLLLLCEVALGDMHERTQADYIEKLPPGKHSCKGVGQTAPNPLQSRKRDDGVEIPLGNGIPSNVKKSSLLYNEYIVYDIAQVRMQYLLKMNFV